MALPGIERQDAFGRPLQQQSVITTLVVFRALQLGDMLCAIPALRALRAAVPDARISLVGLPWAEQFASRFKCYIDDFIAYPGHPAFPEQSVQESSLPGFYARMRNRRFDLAVQMHGSGRISNRIVGAFGAKTVAGFFERDGQAADPACFLAYPEVGAEPTRLLALVEFLGAPSHGTHLEFPLSAQDENELRGSGHAAGLSPGSYVCIHPGARMRNKCWPPQRFAEVADSLAHEFGLSIVLTGSAAEADLTAAVARHMQARAIDAAAPISIGAMAQLMCHARLLICNDTGVSHIAAALRLPSVVVFSQSDIDRWAPLDRHRHRCIWDPERQGLAAVLEQARLLLRAGSPVR